MKFSVKQPHLLLILTVLLVCTFGCNNMRGTSADARIRGTWQSIIPNRDHTLVFQSSRPNTGEFTYTVFNNSMEGTNFRTITGIYTIFTESTTLSNGTVLPVGSIGFCPLATQSSETCIPNSSVTGFYSFEGENLKIGPIVQRFDPETSEPSTYFIPVELVLMKNP